MNIKILFSISFIAIICTYLFFLGSIKTFEIILKEYYFIITLTVLVISTLYFKIKLRNHELINFMRNTISLKQTVVLFLIFQVIDYIYKDGFIGMISQWFLYWIMGLIAFLLVENINYYKNYKLIQNS